MVWKNSPDIEKVVKEDSKIDMSILRKRGNSKSFNGWLIQKIKDARAKENTEMVVLLSEIYKEYKNFEEERVLLTGWKGKSSLKVIEKPEMFTIITYQREDQDSAPQEVKREISKEEVNHIILVLHALNEGEPIPTRKVGEMAYKKDWDTIFADRGLHTQLNLILRLLDYKKQIKYRGGRSLVL